MSIVELERETRKFEQKNLRANDHDPSTEIVMKKRTVAKNTSKKKKSTKQRIEVLQPLEMQYAGAIIDTLGLKQYAGVVPAIAELIANAWDADAENVWVNVPFTPWNNKTKISVIDDGHGMSYTDCQNRFLIVGLNRRKLLKTDKSLEKKRPVLGRKGIGKLAGFGIANKVKIKTIKEKEITEFILDFEKMKDVEFIKPYQPDVKQARVQTKEKSGTNITLSDLRFSRTPNENTFKTSMRNRFSELPDKFNIYVNDDKLEFKEIEVEFRYPPKGYTNEPIENFGNIKWWMGHTSKPLKDSHINGISVYARGKLVQEPFFFELSGGVGGQFSLVYLTGRVYADQLDADVDLISTSRRSVLWSEDPAIHLLNWGRKKIRELSSNWSDMRTNRKTSKLIESIKIGKRFEALDPPIKREVKKSFDKIVSLERIDQDETEELAVTVLELGETDVLERLLTEINKLTPDTHLELLNLMKEEKIHEAIALGKIARIRVSVVTQFIKLIDEKAREVPDIHNYLAEHPWLIDPRFFVSFHERSLDRIIREELEIKDTDESGRIDFFTIRFGNWATVVEIKRPGDKLKIKHVNQLRDYVRVLNKYNRTITEDKKKYSKIDGILVGSKIDEDALYEINDSINLEFRPWESLIDTVNNIYKDFILYLEKIGLEDL